MSKLNLVPLEESIRAAVRCKLAGTSDCNDECRKWVTCLGPGRFGMLADIRDMHAELEHLRAENRELREGNQANLAS